MSPGGGGFFRAVRDWVLRLVLRLLVKPVWRRADALAVLRRAGPRLDRLMGRGAPKLPTCDVTIGDLPACWTGDEPAARRGIVLYLHGGGFCMHLPATYAALAAELSRVTGMRVLLPQYRLAPEHPFPAGLDDCIAAYTWLLAQGTDPARICVAGDSAGGNLTLALLQSIRDRALPVPACAVLLSPVTDLSGSSRSWARNERSDWLFTLHAKPLLCGAYAGDEALVHPRISPLLGDWRGLPPLQFHVSSSEMLLDDSVRAVERAQAAGVNAQLRVWRDLPHAFPVARWMPEARRSLQEIGAFIGAHIQEIR